jgi:mono/diheme cytochrome c family protein
MRPLFAFVVSVPLFAGGCSRAAADLREWRPEDHDRSDEPAGRAAPPARSTASGQRPAASAEAPSAAATLVDVVWKAQCAACHGLAGRGDGPQGPMLHAPDLTRSEWQGKVSDQEIAAVITSGKNRMPKFELPQAVTAALVQRIRALRGQ